MAAAARSLFELTALDIKKNPLPLQKYAGKVTLIVNVASQCGYTNGHYSQLEPLYQKFAPLGFEVLAFPCNQFGGQEPGSNEDVCQFVTKYNVSFQLFDKVDVNGANTHPVYEFLKKHIPGNIKWNFCKYLVSRDGIPYKYCDSKINPADMEGDIQKLLDQKPSS